MKKFGKIDVNHKGIVRDLRKAGASVQSLASVGCGCPDLLVGIRGSNYLLEIKNGNAKLSDAEANWHAVWSGHVRTVRSSEEALKILGLL